MEIGDDDIENALIHSKFHKAKRELLRSQSSSGVSCASSSRDEGTPTSRRSLDTEGGTVEGVSGLDKISSISIDEEPSSSSSFQHFQAQPESGTNKSSGVIESAPIRSPYLRDLRGSGSSSGFSSPSTISTSSATVIASTSSISDNNSTQALEASSVAAAAPTAPTTSGGYPSEVFRFDSTDRERYLCAAISEEEEVFTHEPSPLFTTTTSSFDSPHIILDSPISIGGGGVCGGLLDELPLQVESNSSLLTPHSHSHHLMDISQSRIMATRVHTGLAMLPSSTSVEQTSGLFGGIPSSPVSPLTPNTPLSPSPLLFADGFLAELYRRRCHSDSDLPCLPETTEVNQPTDLSMKTHNIKTHNVIRPRKPIPHPLTIPSKGGSLESDQSSQDSPLDLSIRGGISRDVLGGSKSCDSLTTRFLSSLANSTNNAPGVAVIRGDIASPTTRNSVALRYNLDVSPVVEEMPPGSNMAFVCPVCGQMFSLHDRLAKHMASRHKSKPHDPNRNYPCDVCHRSFARSDMLTRHMRLHTGVKPYTCKTCGQVFSRSDHLSTHQRTHTGEKPYKCPQCCYSACRRDMITRHLRTHTRNSSSSSSDVTSTTSTPTSTTFSASDSFPGSTDELRPIKLEPIAHLLSRPPSSASSFTPDSPCPSSPALNISGLSVKSPLSFFQKDP